MGGDYNLQHSDEKMETTVIPNHLRDVEREFDVKILLAVESGSRAWGFESKNSDWDVRFIYVHKPEWYGVTKKQRDVIEQIYDDNVDLVGWELRKTLRLLQESNPSLFEWLSSPKVYRLDPEFGRRIHEVEKNFYDHERSMFHYKRIYYKHNERYLQKGGYTVKRFLYYLRSILACKWIDSNGTLPPVPFPTLVEATVEEKEIRQLINELIRIKKGEKECGKITVDERLVEYARSWADYYNERSGTYRPEQKTVMATALDLILHDMIAAAWQ